MAAYVSRDSLSGAEKILYPLRSIESGLEQCETDLSAAEPDLLDLLDRIEEIRIEFESAYADYREIQSPLRAQDHALVAAFGTRLYNARGRMNEIERKFGGLLREVLREHMSRKNERG